MYKLYTRPNCIFCDKLKEILKEKAVFYEEIDIYASVNNLVELKSLIPEVKTVPQLFLTDDEVSIVIGGYEASKIYFERI